MMKAILFFRRFPPLVCMAALAAFLAGCPTGTTGGSKPQLSNVGRVFWAVDLDQQDAFNDPASSPWGLVLINPGSAAADVAIEINQGEPGQPLDLITIHTVSIPPGDFRQTILPTRELDGGAVPNSYAAPGTRLSSNAFRITSTVSLIAYQYNVFSNAYSNDASLLIPEEALGTAYRVLGWGAAHPIPVTPIPGGDTIIDRSYVTIVATRPETVVTVTAGWRIRGNPPVAATPAGGQIVTTLNAFDVLNLETDDGTFADDLETISDLSGTYITASAPVAVFTGVESATVPGPFVIPTFPGWSGETGFLDHLEEQLVPLRSVGRQYVVARSPVRSTSGYREPDVIRFVGAAEAAAVTTGLPPPFDSFTLQPGEVKTTWADADFTATADKPFMIGQFLVGQDYVERGLLEEPLGDPAMTIFPSVDQYRREYTVFVPNGWTNHWVVITSETGCVVYADGAPLTSLTAEPSGSIGSTAYESRRCPLSNGLHTLSAERPFGVTLYGYGSAGSYAMAGGINMK